jgi:hypothetical protein
VLVHLRSKFDLLHFDHVLVLLGFARALLLLILVLPVVHDPADGRHRRGRDLHQVETFLSGDGERLGRRHDAELLAGVVDYANFPDADAFVDAKPVITPAWTRAIECDN